MWAPIFIKYLNILFYLFGFTPSTGQNSSLNTANDGQNNNNFTRSTQLSNLFLQFLPTECFENGDDN